MNPVMIIWLSMMISMGILFVLIDTTTRNFVSSFFACRISKGKKVFITILSLNDRYYRTGKVSEENFIDFKSQDKKKKKITIPSGHVFSTMAGFKSLLFDETESTIITPSETIKVYDTGKNQNLYDRALKEVDIKSSKEMLKKNLIPLMILVGVVVVAYFVYQIYTRQGIIGEMLTAMKASIETLQSTGVIQ